MPGAAQAPKKSGGVSNLLLRVLTAVVALPLVIGLVLWDQHAGFALLVLVAAGLALIEYTGIALPTAPGLQRVAVVTTGLALGAGLYLRPDLSLAWVLLALIATATWILLAPGELPGALGRLGAAELGVFYVGALAAPLALLHRDVADGPRWVLLVLAVTFANDTGAYFTGRTLGRHKLYPAISPGKTVEGAIGGLVASVGLALIARATFLPTLTVADVLLVGIPAAIVGPIGDLVESMLKRSAGVKDSGRLLPGHGGMLDRIDALLFVAAWVFVYARHLR